MVSICADTKLSEKETHRLYKISGVFFILLGNVEMNATVPPNVDCTSMCRGFQSPLLPNTMEPSPSLDAASCAATQKLTNILWN
jgi:hypothetical protein